MFTSIPSPDPEWRYLEVPLTWFHDIGLTFMPAAFQIHAYAVFILAGIVVACLLTAYRLKQRGADGWYVVDIALWGVVLGIIGARTFHVLTHPADYFGAGADPWEVIRIWNGGIAIFGALIGGAIGVVVGCRSTGLRFTTVADAIAPGLLIAQAMGRLGNYFNHELFGAPTTLPWGLEIEASNPAFPIGLPETTLFHPTFLYEAIWNLVGAALILFLDRYRHLQWGKALSLYLIWYGAGRSVWETIRVDPSEMLWGIRVNVWMAFIAIAIGIVIWIMQSRAHKGLEPSPFRVGEEDGPSRVKSDTYSEAELASTPATKAKASEPVRAE